MVRLKVQEVEAEEIEEDKFQFQYGTIKGNKEMFQKMRKNIVSIPIWYD